MLAVPGRAARGGRQSPAQGSRHQPPDAATPPPRAHRSRAAACFSASSELDAEERDFKKALENAQFDDEKDEEAGFNEYALLWKEAASWSLRAPRTELEQIEMIERFRSRLVAEDD